MPFLDTREALLSNSAWQALLKEARKSLNGQPSVGSLVGLIIVLIVLSAFFSGTGSALQSSNLTDDLRSQQVTQVNGVRSIYDVSGLFGGPAVKNKLWWVVSARQNGSTTRSAMKTQVASAIIRKFFSA